MCDRCDNKAVVKPWKAWLAVPVTVVILVLTQVFLYGQFTQSVSDHITDDPTHKEMVEEFVTQREFERVIESMNEKLELITNFIKEGK
jgi:hypothetical protein